MGRQDFYRTVVRLLAFGVPGLFFVSSALASAPKETVLYAFQGGHDGSYPWAALAVDHAGNLYGTTYGGGGGPCSEAGLTGCGAVFAVIP